MPTGHPCNSCDPWLGAGCPSPGASHRFKERTAARERSRASAHGAGVRVVASVVARCGWSRNRTRPRPAVTVGEKSKRMAKVGVWFPGVACVVTERTGHLWLAVSGTGESKVSHCPENLWPKRILAMARALRRQPTVQLSARARRGPRSWACRASATSAYRSRVVERMRALAYSVVTCRSLPLPTRHPWS